MTSFFGGVVVAGDDDDGDDDGDEDGSYDDEDEDDDDFEDRDGGQCWVAHPLHDSWLRQFAELLLLTAVAADIADMTESSCDFDADDDGDTDDDGNDDGDHYPYQLLEAYV